MHHGYRCRNLGIGTKRDHCQTILWISQRSEKKGNKTKESCQELALVMKKSSFLPTNPNLIHHNHNHNHSHSQLLPIKIITNPQITGEVY